MYSCFDRVYFFIPLVYVLRPVISRPVAPWVLFWLVISVVDVLNDIPQAFGHVKDKHPGGMIHVGKTATDFLFRKIGDCLREANMSALAGDYAGQILPKIVFIHQWVPLFRSLLAGQLFQYPSEPVQLL